jgi:hypothetical protein
LLICNWPHSVGQNHFFVMMLLNRDSTIQIASRRFFTIYSQKNLIPSSRQDDVIYRPDAHLSKASSVRMTRTFHPGLPLCQEALNRSNLHPSGRFSSMSGRHSEFDQLQDFFPKQRYGKIATTVQTTWIPVRRAHP